MRLRLSLLVIFTLGLMSGLFAKDKVLVYTKNGKGYVHDNIAASVEAIQKMCASQEIDVDVNDKSFVFTPQNLKQYKAIIFANANNEAFDTQEQRNAFQKYIQNGGGFVGIHSSCASERDWPWFWAMVGGTFVRHPKFQHFDIKIIDNTHISTDFLPDPWKWEDECYYLDHLNPDIHVLIAADLRTIEDEKTKEYPGDVFGNYFPLAWYHTFDGGRQFYTALGHKIEHYSDPLLVKHILGGILWTLDRE